ncbi:MAG: hypothetical protein AAGC93_31015 [Cyanobacteria bacterium P01_F01_bin.53]
MLEQIQSINGSPMLPLSTDMLAALGIQPGESVQLTVVGSTLVIQASNVEASVDAGSVIAFEELLEKRRSAYEELAEGAGADE